MEERVRILCVDDEKNVLRALERLFLDDDYEVIAVQSGSEGLEMLRNVSPVHLVISDYRMPGMNGVDFLKEVCNGWPTTVRIVLSGYADTAAIVSAINEGQIYKFIPKPWNDDELKVTVANAIERYFLFKKNLELTSQLTKKNEELIGLNRELKKLLEEKSPDTQALGTVKADAEAAKVEAGRE
jgi:two-component system NtrC family sensor kinase